MINQLPGTAAVLSLSCKGAQQSDQESLHPFAHAVHMLQQQHRLAVISGIPGTGISARC